MGGKKVGKLPFFIKNKCLLHKKRCDTVPLALKTTAAAPFSPLPRPCWGGVRGSLPFALPEVSFYAVKGKLLRCGR